MLKSRFTEPILLKILDDMSNVTPIPFSFKISSDDLREQHFYDEDGSGPSKCG